MRTRFWIAALLLPFALLPAAPAAAGGGCHTFTDGEGPDVDTKHNCFVPAVARVDVGDTVTWRNYDGVPHNVTTSAGFNGEVPIKDSFSHRFTQPGVYPYSCTLHPGMVGAVVVGDGSPVGMDLANATSPSAGTGTPGTGAPAEGASLRWLAVAGALALLLPLLVSSGRIRRQRSAGSAPS